MSVGSESVAERNRQLVLGMYQAMVTGDLETFYAGCADDVVLHEANSLPVGGVHHGRADVASTLGTLIDVYDMGSALVHRLLVDERYVVAMLTVSTAGADPYQVAITEWWQIEDGKVVEIRPYYWDTEELNRALAAD